MLMAEEKPIYEPSKNDEKESVDFADKKNPSSGPNSGVSINNLTAKWAGSDETVIEELELEISCFNES